MRSVIRKTVVVAFATLTGIGCGNDSGDRECTQHGDCALGFVCFDSVCQELPRTDTRTDAGVVMRFDSGMRDAGRPEAGRLDPERTDAGQTNAGGTDARAPDDAGTTRRDASSTEPDANQSRPDAGSGVDSSQPDAGQACYRDCHDVGAYCGYVEICGQQRNCGSCPSGQHCEAYGSHGRQCVCTPQPDQTDRDVFRSAANVHAGTASSNWVNLGQAVRTDSRGASFYTKVDATSPYLEVTNAGLRVPSGAHIRGIEVTYRLALGEKNNPRTPRIETVRLIGPRTSSNRARTIHIPTDNTYYAFRFGGSSDTWGQTWTASDVNRSNFGARLQITGNGEGNYYVDSVEVQVFYEICH